MKKKSSEHLPKSAWQFERAVLLTRLCGYIQSQSAKGFPIRKLIARHSRRWNGKTFKSGKPIRLSEMSLRRAFYRWRKSQGVTPFKLGYKGSFQRSIPIELILEALRRSLSFHNLSVSDVINGLQKDWRSGKRIAGLGTLSAWINRTGKMSNALPHRHSLHRHLAATGLLKRKGAAI